MTQMSRCAATFDDLVSTARHAAEVDAGWLKFVECTGLAAGCASKSSRMATGTSGAMPGSASSTNGPFGPFFSWLIEQLETPIPIGPDICNTAAYEQCYKNTRKVWLVAATACVSVVAKSGDVRGFAHCVLAATTAEIATIVTVCFFPNTCSEDTVCCNSSVCINATKDVHQEYLSYALQGELCDIKEQFTLSAESAQTRITGQFTIIPDGQGGGSYTFLGSMRGALPPGIVTAKGVITIDDSSCEMPTLRLGVGSWKLLQNFPPPVGPVDAPLGPNGDHLDQHDVPILLAPSLHACKQ